MFVSPVIVKSFYRCSELIQMVFTKLQAVCNQHQMLLTASCFQSSSDLAHNTPGFTFGISLKWVQQQFFGMIKIVQGTK